MIWKKGHGEVFRKVKKFGLIKFPHSICKTQTRVWVFLWTQISKISQNVNIGGSPKIDVDFFPLSISFLVMGLPWGGLAYVCVRRGFFLNSIFFFVEISIV